MQTYERDADDVLLDCIEIVFRKTTEYPDGCEVHTVLKEIVDKLGEVQTWRITR